jgi:uncharacterized protein
MIFDFHTHVFSPEVIAGRSSFAARDRWFGQLYSNPRSRLVAPDELLTSMDKTGIDKAVICGFPWSDVGICATENDFLLEVAANSQGRLISFATVPPQAGPEAIRQAERALSAGSGGLGELNACAQGFYFGDTALLRPLMEVVVAYNAPVLLHSSEPAGRLYPGKGKASLQGLYRMATAFPQTHFVLAHWGGGLPFYELMPEVRKAMANCWYDTAASAYLYQQSVFDITVRLVGARKILFGSDFPVIGQQRMLDETRSAGLDSSALSAILGGNAVELLGLAKLDASSSS